MDLGTKITSDHEKARPPIISDPTLSVILYMLPTEDTPKDVSLGQLKHNDFTPYRVDYINIVSGNKITYNVTKSGLNKIQSGTHPLKLELGTDLEFAKEESYHASGIPFDFRSGTAAALRRNYRSRDNTSQE